MATRSSLISPVPFFVFATIISFRMDLASGANNYCSRNLALASPEMAYAQAKEKIVANAWQDVD